jgi:hypothetical protein
MQRGAVFLLLSLSLSRLSSAQSVCLSPTADPTPSSQWLFSANQTRVLDDNGPAKRSPLTSVWNTSANIDGDGANLAMQGESTTGPSAFVQFRHSALRLGSDKTPALGTSDFAISAWVRMSTPRAAPLAGQRISCGDQQPPYWNLWLIRNNTIRFETGPSDRGKAFIVDSKPFPRPDAWNFVVAWRNGSTLGVGVNGVQSTAPYPSAHNLTGAPDFNIGYWRWPCGELEENEYLSGDLGDVRLFVGNLPRCAAPSPSTALTTSTTASATAASTTTTGQTTAQAKTTAQTTAQTTTTAQTAAQTTALTTAQITGQTTTTAQTAGQTTAQTTAQTAVQTRTPSIGGTTTSISSTSSHSELSAVDTSASSHVDTTGTSPAIAPAPEQVDIALIAGAVGGSLAGLLLVAVIAGFLWKWKARSRETAAEIRTNAASELAATASQSHYARYDQVPLPSAIASVPDYGHGSVHSFT